MARVFLTCTAEQLGAGSDRDLYALRTLRDCAAKDRRKAHQPVADEREADWVLFVEGHVETGIWGEYLEGLRSTPLYRRRRETCFVFSGMDLIVPTVPGVYASVERDWQVPSLTRGGCYLLPRNPFLSHLPLPDLGREPAWLGSFVGCAADIPIRLRLVELKDERLCLRDNTKPFIASLREGRSEDHERLKKDYISVTQDSKFVICPRGKGASSIRLFEAMEMGRAPVVLSDAWVMPEGPRWDDFCLRVPERHADRLGSLLREREPEAAARGALARAEWETWFSPESLFHTLSQACEDLLRGRRAPYAWLALRARLQFLRPLHLRNLLRRFRARFRKTAAP